MRLLWCINVFSRFDDLKFLVNQVKSELGCDVLVYCNNPNPGDFQVPGVDIFLTGPNSGHHNGARDAVNAALSHLDGYDYVVSSHADNVWSELRNTIFNIMARMRAEKFEAAFLTGDPVKGAMNDISNFGYFGDFFIMTVDAYRRSFPIDRMLDDQPRGWYEVALADYSIKALGREKILDIPAQNDHETHDFFDIMGDPRSWMLGNHEFEEKMKKLKESRSSS